MLAFMQEHGPWVMDDGDVTFHENQYSWNTNANMLYIEMPAGVGFSYCNKTEGSIDNCTFTDTNSAEQNLIALRNWFDRFPEYKSKELYLAGESYSGIYVPLLLDQIDLFNQNAEEPINLKGMMVGNGVTNWKYDTTPATVYTAWSHELISYELHDQMVALDCDYSGDALGVPSTPECEALLDQMNDEMEVINIYNIYGTCYEGDQSDASDE